MKKIFLLISALPLLVCGRFYYDPDRFVNDAQDWSEEVADDLHTLVERNHENYWLNNIRPFKTYPINWYSGGRINASTYDVGPQTQVRSTHEYPRNVAISANLGQRMVDRETYNVYISDLGEHFEASAEGEVTNSAYNIKLKKGQVLTPVGEVDINGRFFTLFEPEHDGRMLLTDETGLVMHAIGHYHRGELLMSRDATTIMPKDLRILKSSDVKQSASSPQMQYAIEYNGIVEDNMEFIYNDYTDGNVRKTFVFPRNQQIININGVKIKVLNPAADHIEYILLN